MAGVLSAVAASDKDAAGRVTAVKDTALLLQSLLPASASDGAAAVAFPPSYEAVSAARASQRSREAADRKSSFRVHMARDLQVADGGPSVGGRVLLPSAYLPACVAAQAAAVVSDPPPPTPAKVSRPAAAGAGSGPGPALPVPPPPPPKR